MKCEKCGMILFPECKCCHACNPKPKIDNVQFLKLIEYAYMLIEAIDPNSMPESWRKSSSQWKQIVSTEFNKYNKMD